jgi:8-oxo-dGTP diphosphatase
LPESGRIFVIRHARAGDRERWTGDDRLRPIDDRGRLQAEQLARRLPISEISSIRSSPYLRCMQTVEPLARAIRGDVRPDDALVEGHSLQSFLDLLLDLPPGTAVCGHGDMIGDLVLHLSQRDLLTEEPRWPKASTWVLDYSEGLPQGASYIGPPNGGG